MSGNARDRRRARRALERECGIASPDATELTIVAGTEAFAGAMQDVASAAERASDALRKFSHLFGIPPGTLVSVYGFIDPEADPVAEDPLADPVRAECDQSVRERLREEPFDDWLARTARVIEEARHDRR